MKLAKIAAAVAASVIMVGCESTPQQVDHYTLEPGSLRLQTQIFGKKYGIDMIAYHHSIAPSDDFIIDAKREIYDPSANKQYALQQMFSGSPYIPLLDDNVVTVYPLTTRVSPLAGQLRTEMKMATTNKHKRVRTEGAASVQAVDKAMPSHAKVTNTGPSQPTTKTSLELNRKGEAHKQPLNNDKVIAKTTEPKLIKGTHLAHADTTKSPSVRSENKVHPTKVDKPQKLKENSHALLKGQSYRDVFSKWLNVYGVDRVVYATTPKLRERLVAPATKSTSISSTSLTELMTNVVNSLGEENSAYRFKVRVVPYEGDKIAVVHQFSSHDVSLFQVKQGSLRDNAYRLAKQFGYDTAESTNAEFTSWGLDTDPQIQSNTLKAMPNNVRIAFGVLFHKHNVKARLLDGDKTVFFAPRNNYRITNNES